MNRRINIAQGLAALCTAACVLVATAAAGQLASWNDGPARQAIVRFVNDVTTPGSAKYVAAADRIAVFDNDGTLWAEQPLYFQLAFMLDQVRRAAPRHPEWRPG